MAIEIVSFPIKIVFLHSYVNVYQMENPMKKSIKKAIKKSHDIPIFPWYSHIIIPLPSSFWAISIYGTPHM